MFRSVLKHTYLYIRNLDLIKKQCVSYYKTSGVRENHLPRLLSAVQQLLKEGDHDERERAVAARKVPRDPRHQAISEHRVDEMLASLGKS